MRRAIALAALLSAAGGAASAEISMFGDARLGLGYGILNNGEPDERAVTNADGVVTGLDASDDLRAVSRVRFGVVMTGETDGGLAFGAQIRADNARGGEGGAVGQRSGNVFVSGAYGTLTFGDTNGADYFRVGDVVGNVSLTGLGDYYELPFLSNGGGSDNDQLQFLADPDDRPTVRYDYDYGDFGLSVSTNRDLNSVAVGGDYQRRFGETGSIHVGLGYYDFSDFEGNVANVGEVDVPAGDQIAGSLVGSWRAYEGGVGFTSIDAGDLGRLDVLTLGGGADYGPWALRAYYAKVTNGDEAFGTAFDGKDSYGASAAYDLGGGATINMGVARSYGADAVGTPGQADFFPSAEAATLADLGVRLNF